MTVHWCGTGLSSGPGLRRLIGAGLSVTVWNDDTDQARALVGDLTGDIHAFGGLLPDDALHPGDVVVSMLPADLHVPLARQAIGQGAHFVTSSYVSPAMRALDDAARAAGVAVVNEVGLDPGIDHLMAHALIADYRKSGAFDPANVLSFASVCGGFPARPDGFRYKFSWSPLGVLRALCAPAQYRQHFTDLTLARPWQGVRRYDAPLARPESFEVYPNRDSLAFLADYRFDPEWKVRDFLRGTLRPLGWAEAWEEVFQDLERLDGDEAGLKTLSDRLWRDHAYGLGEADRVVLCVSLRAERHGRAVYDRIWTLDATGDLRGSAMARLVSGPVSLAAEAVLNRELPAGVQSAPHDPRLVTRWLEAVRGFAGHLTLTDRLA